MGSGHWGHNEYLPSIPLIFNQMKPYLPSNLNKITRLSSLRICQIILLIFNLQEQNYNLIRIFMESEQVQVEPMDWDRPIRQAASDASDPGGDGQSSSEGSSNPRSLLERNSQLGFCKTNRATQLIIAIKQIMNKYVLNMIRDPNIDQVVRSVITSVWEKYRQCNRNKEILAVMFNQEVSYGLVTACGFEEIWVHPHFRESMKILRRKMVKVMISRKRIEQHMENRRMKSGRRAFVDYVLLFVNKELRHGKIKTRTNERNNMMLEQLARPQGHEMDYVQQFIVDVREEANGEFNLQKQANSW